MKFSLCGVGNCSLVEIRESKLFFCYCFTTLVVSVVLTNGGKVEDLYADMNKLSLQSVLF